MGLAQIGLRSLEFGLGIRVRVSANRVRVRAIAFSIRVIRVRVWVWVSAIRVGFMLRAVRVRASRVMATRVMTIGVSVKIRAIRVSVKNRLKFLLGLGPFGLG